MFDEPEFKRAVSFLDGQNLLRHAKDAFGHHHPNTTRASSPRRCVPPMDGPAMASGSTRGQLTRALKGSVTL